jgi:LysW-gamma-L-lysine carboxypeptidase
LAIRLWTRIQLWLAGQNNGAPAGFESIDATLRSINTTGDGLNERATLEITFRLPPGVTISWLRKHVDGLAFGADFSWRPNAEAYRVDKRSPLVAPFLAAIRAAGGQPRLKVKTGTSDMNLVGPAWNCPILSYGPGDARFDHTPDEQIPLADFERGVEVLVSAVEAIALRGTRDAGRGTRLER